jgi:ribosomal protein S18 acetylase RimI-like enzyme
MALFTVRTLAGADAADYREIRLAALKSAPQAFGSSWQAEVERPLSHFAERLTSSVVLAAYGSAGVIGMAGYKQHGGARERHKAFVWGAYVQPDMRRHGVALRLMQELIVSAAGRVEQLTLMVVEGNAEALALYRRCGFEVYGVAPRALKGPAGYADEILMVRFLSGTPGAA